MATKNQTNKKTARALLDKLSVSLKQTIANDPAEKNITRAKNKAQQEQQQRELMKTTATIMSHMKIV